MKYQLTFFAKLKKMKLSSASVVTGTFKTVKNTKVGFTTNALIWMKSIHELDEELSNSVHSIVKVNFSRAISQIDF